MPKNNFYVSYSTYDGIELSKRITARLKRKGYTVWSPDDPVPEGASYVEHIVNTITNCDYFLPVVTDGYAHSSFGMDELEFVISTSNERAKKIIPIVFTKMSLPAKLSELLKNYQQLQLKDTEDLSAVIHTVERLVEYDAQSVRLYEALAEYTKLNHDVKVAVTLCQLVELLCLRWNDPLTSEQRKLGIELCRLLQKLAQYSGEDNKALAHKILDALNPVSELLHTESAATSMFHKDIFFASCAINLAFWDREVRKMCADMITCGDVSQGIINPFPFDRFLETQKPYVQILESTSSPASIHSNTDPHFTPEEIVFIEQTKTLIRSWSKSDLYYSRSQTTKNHSLSEDEEILITIAKFMQEGNKLFDVLQKRGIAGDFLKCLMTSYERLKNYCQIVDAKDVAADCVERIWEIREQIERQDSNPTDNEKVENGIKSLLGFTLHGSGNYDVFISFKNEDSDLAEKIYHLCRRHMKVPFWSKRSLPELSKSEYEDAIYDALRKSKHFVVVLSNLKYLNAGWIMREMKAFDRAITEGRKPGGNFVIVATDKVYDEIIQCNKMCLDERYCGYQILKMSEYEKTLLSYIK